jgi:hypothetical protein
MVCYYTHTHTGGRLGDAEREDGLCLLCNALLFSLGTRHEGLSRTKLEDVPQVVLQSLAMPSTT